MSVSDFDPYSEDTAGFFSSIGKGLKAVGKVAGKGLQIAATPITAPAHLIAKATRNIPILGTVTGAVDSLNAMPFKVTQQILEGGNISKVALGNLKQALSNVKALGPYVQTVISFVPGVGTGVSAAIGAGLALAEGQSITEAMMAGVKGALPGGPAAKMAFDVAKGAIERKPLDQIAIAALPISDQQKKLLVQGMSAVKDIAAGKNVAKSIVDNAVKSLPPEYAKAVQIGMAMGHAKSLQAALKTGAAGAASVAMNSGAAKNLAGKAMNPFIKAASNLGSTQGAIQKAVGAAQAIQNGSPVLKNALKSAVGNFAHGSPEHVGFSTAVNVLKKTAGNKVAMGVARRALPNEAARKAFDSAIGVVSNTVSKNPGALAQRAGAAFSPMMGRAKGKFSVHQPALQGAIDSIKRNPTLAAQHPMVLASKLGTSQQTVIDAVKNLSGQRLLPWRSMSPGAMSFIQKWSPLSSVRSLGHGTRDTAGLDETGTKYIVEKGDFPFKIAQKLTGNGNRWVELKPLNTDKKPDITKNVWVGEVLNIPASWQKPIVKPTASNAPASTSQPAPSRQTATPAAKPSISVAPGILQAKSILVAWSKTDGVNQAGVPDYGSTAADLSTDFGPRDKLELTAFQSWTNKTNGAKLVVDGKLGPKSLAALQSWAESRASQATSSAASPVVTTLPEIVIEASAPVKSAGIPQVSAPTPASAIVVSAPVLPSLPAPSLPPVPVIAPPSQPATPASVAAASPPSSSGSKFGPALAGAALGGTLFGLPGAIIGGIAGAAIS